MKHKLLLMGSGALQLMLIAFNTYQIAHQHLLGAILASFAISMVWSFNIQKLAFGNIWDRLCYSAGAAMGTGIGLAVSMWIY